MATKVVVQNPYVGAENLYRIMTHDHACIMNRWDPGTHAGSHLPGELLQYYMDFGTSYVSIAGQSPRLACPSCGSLTYQRRALNDSDLLVTECYNENNWIGTVNNEAVTFTASNNTVSFALGAAITLEYSYPIGLVVYFSSIVGTTGITTNTPYYIVIGAWGGMQLSLTQNGPPITFTNDGTGLVYVLSYVCANHSDTDDDWWFLPYTLAAKPGNTPIPAKGTVPGSFQAATGFTALSGYVYTEGIDFTTSSTPITQFGRTRYVLSVNFVDQTHLPPNGYWIYPSYHLNISGSPFLSASAVTGIPGLIWDYGDECTANFPSGHTSHDIVIGTIENLTTLLTGNVAQIGANCHANGLLWEAADCYLITSDADVLAGNYDVTEVTNFDSGQTDWMLDIFAANGQMCAGLGVDDVQCAANLNQDTTWVYADELTKEAIFASLKAGNNFAARTNQIPGADLLMLESVKVNYGDETSVTITTNHPAIYQWITLNSWPNRTVVPNTYPPPVRTTGTRWNGLVGGGVTSDTYVVQPNDGYVRAVLTATPSTTSPVQYGETNNQVWTNALLLSAYDEVTEITTPWDNSQSNIDGLFNVRLAG